MAMSADFGLASEDMPRRDAQVIIELITRARDGDRQAWDALVGRYAPLIWAICRRHRLDQADAENVAQIIWLRLLEQLETIRDRAALAGWLATPPGGNESGSCGPGGRSQPGTCPTPATFPMTNPERPSRNCSRPSVTRRCARHSRACPHTASG